MVKSSQVESAVASLRRLVDKLRGLGFPAACVVSTREGALLTHGSPAIMGIIKDHCEEIFTHDGYVEEFEAPVPAAAVPPQVLLPLIEPPLSQQKFQSCR